MPLYALPAGKRCRLTLLECGNDINTMIDVAKLADLVCSLAQLSLSANQLPHPLQVLLLVDASFGFEMETFEFLNILQVHGFPKVMGVLTHLDVFTSAKTLRKTKKRLKQRFWTEIYQVGLVHEHRSPDCCSLLVCSYVAIHAVPAFYWLPL